MVPPISSMWLLGSVALLCASLNVMADDGDGEVTAPQANAAISDLSEPVTASPMTSRRHVRIAKDHDGLFYVLAKVNGTTVRFLVDTGANLVVLTPEDARRVGAEGRAARDTVATASGHARMDRVTLDNVSIAGHEIHDIDAAIMHRGLSVSLMGQNMLAKLGPITISADEMSLRRAR